MSNPSVVSVLDSFRRQRLLVIGDVMLDENLWGKVRRVSPEAPVPVVELEEQTWVPGGAANSATNAVGLGATAFLGGVVGQDESAAKLRQCLLERGVNAEGLVVDRSRPTTLKTRVVAHNQQVIRMDRELRAPIPPEVQARLLEWAARMMGAVDACVISDYGKGVVSETFARELIALAAGSGTPIVVDPKGYDYDRYRGATVLTPNLHEAEQAARHPIQSPDDLLVVGRRLLEHLGGGAVLITRGAEGMSLFVADGVVHVPAEAHAVFDVTGAGDTAITTLALALAARAPLELAVRLANRAAGIVVGKVGTSAVTLAELRRSLRDARRARGARTGSRMRPRR